MGLKYITQNENEIHWNGRSFNSVTRTTCTSEQYRPADERSFESVSRSRRWTIQRSGKVLCIETNKQNYHYFAALCLGNMGKEYHDIFRVRSEMTLLGVQPLVAAWLRLAAVAFSVSNNSIIPRVCICIVPTVSSCSVPTVRPLSHGDS
jgi:hypothetical protein